MGPEPHLNSSPSDETYGSRWIPAVRLFQFGQICLENGGEWGSGTALLHIDSLGKRGAGPTRRHRGNPLVVPVWETAFEVDLKLRRPAGHVPRPVGALRRQQKFDAFPVHVL